MPENTDIQIGEDLQTWIKQRLDRAVRDLTNQGLVGSLLVEAKPAWVLPFALLIGKIRSKGEPGAFTWFICGDAPTDHAHSSVASSPREAAKYFALKWQLDAARRRATDESPSVGPDPGTGRRSPDLAERAEALYQLVEEKRLWLEK